MLKIEAIIRNSTLHDVQTALAELDIPTFTSYEVKMTGIHKGHKSWRNKSSDFIPKAKIEILTSEHEKDKVVNAIKEAAKTGEKGDGIVFVYPIENIIKIRNGDSGESALK